jgi:hypothetical protein
MHKILHAIDDLAQGARINHDFLTVMLFRAAMMAMDSVPCLVTPTILLLNQAHCY